MHRRIVSSILMLILFFLCNPVFIFAENNEHISRCVKGAFKPGSEVDGFRNTKWDTDVTNISDLELIGTDKDFEENKTYLIKNDNLEFEKVKLASITYAFWSGKLYGIRLYTKGNENWEQLKKNVFDKFGEGEYSKGLYFYQGDTTKMSLFYEETSQIGCFEMLSEKSFREHEISIMEKMPKDKFEANIQANDASAEGTVITISTVMENYFANYGKYPTDECDLVKASPPFLSNTFNNIYERGYVFSVKLDSNTYKVIAMPFKCMITGTTNFIVENGKEIVKKKCR